LSNEPYLPVAFKKQPQLGDQLAAWQSRTLRRRGARAKQQKQGNLLLQASILSSRTKRLQQQRHGITWSAYLPVAFKKQPQLGADREVICSRSRFMTQCPTVICTESPRRATHCGSACGDRPAPRATARATRRPTPFFGIQPGPDIVSGVSNPPEYALIMSV
jgi:hypothetical protein